MNVRLNEVLTSDVNESFVRSFRNETKKWYNHTRKIKTSASWFEHVFEIWNVQIFMLWIEISIVNVKNIQSSSIWYYWRTICSKFTNQISYSCKITFLFISSKKLNSDSTIMIQLSWNDFSTSSIWISSNIFYFISKNSYMIIFSIWKKWMTTMTKYEKFYSMRCSKHKNL